MFLLIWHDSGWALSHALGGTNQAAVVIRTPVGHCAGPRETVAALAKPQVSPGLIHHSWGRTGGAEIGANHRWMVSVDVAGQDHDLTPAGRATDWDEQLSY